MRQAPASAPPGGMPNWAATACPALAPFAALRPHYDADSQPEWLSRPNGVLEAGAHVRSMITAPADGSAECMLDRSYEVAWVSAFIRKPGPGSDSVSAAATW